VPNRVGGAATFHGGGLVTDKPDSPHLLIPKMKAQFLIAIAENDDKNDKLVPPSRDQLKKAFADNKLKAEVEVYAGSMHGWCPPDSGVYDMDLAEKAWARLLATFKSALV
jgi:carboxymethylenebutenolidase